MTALASIGIACATNETIAPMAETRKERARRHAPADIRVNRLAPNRPVVQSAGATTATN